MRRWRKLTYTTGFFVYALWGEDPDCPLYVGRSSNLLLRIGTHLTDPVKREAVQKVTVSRCASERAMIRAEEKLIAAYRPPWNIVGVGEEERALRRGPIAKPRRRPRPYVWATAPEIPVAAAAADALTRAGL